MLFNDLKKEVTRRASFDTLPFVVKEIDVEKSDYQTLVIGEEKFALKDSAVEQFLWKLNVKAPIYGINKYYEESAQRNEVINKIFRFAVQENANLQLQMIVDGDSQVIEGVVGRKYTLTTHEDVFEIAVDKFGKKIDDRLTFINDRYMKIAFKSDMERNANVGEVVSVGMEIFNSDTGWSALGYGLMFWFLRCTNGLQISREYMQAKIYHSASNPIERYLASVHEEMNAETLDGFVDMIDLAYNKPALIDSWEEIPSIVKPYGVPKRFHEGIVDYAQKTPEQVELPKNYFGIGNAVNGYATHYAQTPETRQELLIPSFNIIKTGVKY